jgi:zinc transport system substrate-binding protein
MIGKGIVALICLFASVALPSSFSWSKEAVDVWVSILPQKYFVERIAGGLARVSVMVQPGANPETYEPRPAQLRRMARSDIYFAIGVPFERVWLKKISALNPLMQVIRTDKDIKKREMLSGHHHGERDPLKKRHSKGDNGPGEPFKDPHVWLSPPLVKIQANVIADAFIRIDPSNKSIYENNLKGFQAELDRLDSELRELFAGTGQKTEFLVFHPSWGYFADAYGLRQIAVETEGKEPSAADTVRLIGYCKEKGIKLVFAQPQFSAKSAKIIAREIGGKVVFIDPLSERWVENLQAVARELKASLR